MKKTYDRYNIGTDKNIDKRFETDKNNIKFHLFTLSYIKFIGIVNISICFKK